MREPLPPKISIYSLSSLLLNEQLNQLFLLSNSQSFLFLQFPQPFELIFAESGRQLSCLLKTFPSFQFASRFESKIFLAFYRSTNWERDPDQNNDQANPIRGSSVR